MKVVKCIYGIWWLLKRGGSACSDTARSSAVYEAGWFSHWCNPVSNELLISVCISSKAPPSEQVEARVRASVEFIFLISVTSFFQTVK